MHSASKYNLADTERRWVDSRCNHPRNDKPNQKYGNCQIGDNLELKLAKFIFHRNLPQAGYFVRRVFLE